MLVIIIIAAAAAAAANATVACSSCSPLQKSISCPPELPSGRSSRSNVIKLRGRGLPAHRAGWLTISAHLQGQSGREQVAVSISEGRPPRECRSNGCRPKWNYYPARHHYLMTLAGSAAARDSSIAGLSREDKQRTRPVCGWQAAVCILAWQIVSN